MISANLSAVFYLISGILFILALRGLSSPDTSRQGNYFGIAGMIIAIVVTFLSIGNFSTSLVYVIIFLLIGGFYFLVKGNKKQIKAFAKALVHEKDYYKHYKKYGLDDPKTYRSKYRLKLAIKKFERKTGIKWPLEFRQG